MCQALTLPTLVKSLEGIVEELVELVFRDDVIIMNAPVSNSN